MNSIPTILGVSLVALIACLASPATGAASDQKSRTMAYEKFFSMPLGEKEVAFMPLGSYSNVIIRVGGKTLLFDPASLMQDELAAVQKGGIDLVVYTHNHSDHFNADTAAQISKGSNPVFAVEEKVYNLLKGKISDSNLDEIVKSQNYLTV